MSEKQTLLLNDLEQKITRLQESIGPEFQQIIMKHDFGFAGWNVLNAYSRKLSAEVTGARETVNKLLELAEGHT